MQTFLPYPDFRKSATCLDYRRLGKQRVETKQIYSALIGEKKGWKNHPATRMWAGYERALLEYGIVVCEAWRARGYKDSCLNWFKEKLNECKSDLVLPPWVGNKNFHAAHRSNLLRKDAEFYGQYNWSEPNDLPYIWPVQND